jgi:hypothetical protein
VGHLGASLRSLRTMMNGGRPRYAGALMTTPFARRPEDAWLSRISNQNG